MAQLGWDDSYFGKLRALAGDEATLLHVGARCVIRDEAGRVLLIRRSDNGNWSLPAGGIELGESITDCAIREAAEETGLTVTELTPFAIYSGPAYTNKDMYGHTYDLITFAFRVDAYHGALLTETDETTDARFYAMDALPSPCTRRSEATLADLADYERTGRLIMK